MARHEAVDAAGHDAITAEINDYLERTRISDTDLANRTGVAQSFIWNLKRGNFQRITPRLRRVRQYIHMEAKAPDKAVEGVNEAIQGFIRAGGDLAVLRSGIEMLTRAYADA